MFFKRAVFLIVSVWIHALHAIFLVDTLISSSLFVRGVLALSFLEFQANYVKVKLAKQGRY